MKPKEAETPAAKEPQKLTPYQGKRKCFGGFQCSKCNRQWSSGHSWANISQACKACNTKVYPKHQIPLRRRKKRKSHGGDPSKAHAKELCGKCQQLGFSCVFFDRKEQVSEAPSNGEPSNQLKKKEKTKKKKKRSKSKAVENEAPKE